MKVWVVECHYDGGGYAMGAYTSSERAEQFADGMNRLARETRDEVRAWMESDDAEEPYDPELAEQHYTVSAVELEQ